MRLDTIGLNNVLTNNVHPSYALKISEALHDCLHMKRVGKPETFHQAAMRSASVIIELCGDKACPDFRTIDAGLLRDTLIDRGFSVASDRRSFSIIKAIFNLAVAEHGLEIRIHPYQSSFLE
tara:strand:- start:310 stop:675 length:366 start_codon:yes stop_codon:yes gene_type:complete